MRAYTLDGFDLTGTPESWFLARETRLPASGGDTVVSVSAPSLDYVVPVRQGSSVGRVGLEFVVRGGIDRVAANASTLTGILRAGRVLGMVEGGRTLETGVVEVAVSEPAWSNGNASARVSAVVTVQPVWAAGVAKTVTRTGTSGQWNLTTDFPGSAGVTDAVLRVTGPVTSFGLRGFDGTGVDVRLVSAGQYVFVDLATGRSWVSASASAWTSTTAGGVASIDFPPEGMWRPRPTLTAEGLQLTVQVTGSAGGVAVHGREAWY